MRPPQRRRPPASGGDRYPDLRRPARVTVEAFGQTQHTELFEIYEDSHLGYVMLGGDAGAGRALEEL